MADYISGDGIKGEDITAKAKEVVEAAFKKRKKERDSNEADTTIMNEGNPGLVYDKLTDDEIRTELEWIVPLFESYLKPVPGDFDVFVPKLQEIAGYFNVGKDGFTDDRLQWIGSVMDTLDNWDGTLADNFRDNFLRPIPTIAGNQGKLASALYENGVAMKAIYIGGRQDALEIAKKTVDAIDAIAPVKGLESLKIFLTVVIALSGFAGPALTAAGTAGKALISSQLATASIAGGAIMAGPFIKDTDGGPLGADTVEEVLNNMKEALKKVDERMKTEEDKVIEAFKKIDEVVDPLLSGSETTSLIPMLPELHMADKEKVKEAMLVLDRGRDGGNGNGGNGNGGNGNGGGRGSWFGDGAPPDWDGSVHNPPGNDTKDKMEVTNEGSWYSRKIPGQ